MNQEHTLPNMDIQEQIAISEIADELQCRKQSLFKIARRLNITPAKQRDFERGNQFVSMVTNQQAEDIKREFLSRKKVMGENGVDEILDSDEGVFYIVQLEPEHDPGRIKLGFTTDLEGRLRKHRCAAPFSQCVVSWPCRRNWERTAIDSMTDQLEQLYTEVFRTNSLEETIKRGEKFFSVMPKINTVSEKDSLESTT
jgi:hypothetical protein